MRKLKNILFVFVALFIFVGVAKAETLKEEVSFKYGTNENAVVDDVKEVDGGIILVGSKDYDKASQYGYIAYLNEKGTVVWEKDYKVNNAKVYLNDIVLLNDYIFISAYSHVTVGEEVTREYYILVYKYDGTFVKKINVNADDFGFKLAGYKDYYGIMLGETGGLKLYKASDDSLVGSTEDGFGTDVVMNDEGIYVTQVSYETGITSISLYDYSVKMIKSSVIRKSGINAETNKYTDAFILARFIVTDNYVYCLGFVEGYGEYTDVYTIYSLKKDDFSIINKVEYKVGTIEEIGSYKDYLIGGVLKVCSGDSPCDVNKSPMVVFDNNLNIKAQTEVNYWVRGIAGNGIYVVGHEALYHGESQENLEAFVTKFSYDLGVEVKVAENGNVKLENIDNADGTTTIKLNITPEKGYVVKSVVVKDADGKTIEVKDDTFVKPDTDVTVEVLFEKETVKNPNTGLSNPFMICGIALAGAGIGYCFLKKKKYI
ncbi:MAG: hypothetical protein IJN90_07660 [Bacilli bacterium]|nr:hypothetical protein [Bacilli bacterium]